MKLCFDVTEAEVERAKNVFKTSLFMHLDGEFLKTWDSVTLSVVLCWLPCMVLYTAQYSASPVQH